MIPWYLLKFIFFNITPLLCPFLLPLPPTVMMMTPMPCHHHQKTNKGCQMLTSLQPQVSFYFLLFIFLLFTNKILRYWQWWDDTTTTRARPSPHPPTFSPTTHHNHHQWVPVTCWLVFLAFHPPCSPPPPTSPSDLLVAFSGSPPTMWPNTTINESYWLIGGLPCDREGSSDKNGPRWCQTCCLGHRWVFFFFFFFCVFLILTIVFVVYYVK